MGVLFIALVFPLLVMGSDVERVNTCADDAVAFDKVFLNVQKNHIELIAMYRDGTKNGATNDQLKRFDASNNNLADQHDAKVNSSERIRLTSK